MALRPAARLDSLWSGEMMGIVMDGVKVLLVNLDGRVCAYEDRCAHQRVPLSQGRLCGRVLTCAAHEWQYDACTGHGLNPQGVALRRFPVCIEGGDILLDVAAPETREEEGR